MCKTTTYAIGFGWCWVFASPVHASILYSKVTASGFGNCSSWDDACTLTTALGNATAGDQIWVQGGTYGPISLKNGVKIIGGFAGTETSAAQSDPVTNATIIDGGGVRAVTASGVNSSTMLRGFRITNGFDADTDGGGGLHVQDGSPRIVACVFDNNGASFFGGAVSILGASSPEFFNCRFYGCTAGLAGGAVYVFGDALPVFTNCLFYGNQAASGGAIVNEFGNAKFFNCTMVGNDATVGGGGAVHDEHGRASIHNSILWNNTAVRAGAQIFFGLNRTTAVRRSDVEGGFVGAGNIDADPLFVDADGLDGIPGTDDDDLRLQPGSPCIDAANNTVVRSDTADLDGDGDTTERTPLDLDGNPRFADDPATADSGIGTPPIVDMGAYEFQVCGNGVVGIGEECDDGNSVDGDGCDNNCTFTTCGNGIQTAGEECDDGNAQPGDGCDATCHIEPEVIPTVSEWGLVILTLLLLTGAKIYFGRHRPART